MSIRTARHQLPDYGLGDEWRGDPIGRREVTRTVIDHTEDWLRLPRLAPDRGFVARFGECVRMVRADTPSDVPVIITVFDPMFQAVTLAGEPLIHKHFREAPEAVEAGLRRLTENTVDLIGHLIGLGADGIFLAAQHAIGSVFPESIFEKYAMPGIFGCLEAMAGAPFNMVHVHGAGIHDRLFTRLRGCAIHYDMWADNPSPQRFLAAGCAVATGPSPSLLASDAPDADVTAACEALLAAGTRTILSPGCSVPLAVGADRLRLISDSAQRRYA